VIQQLKAVTKPRGGKGHARLFGMFSAVLIVSWTLSGWLAVHDHQRIKVLESQLAKYQADTVEEHHVVIVRKLQGGDWAMRSDEESELVFRPCPSDLLNGVDDEGLIRQGVGWVAEKARWEERGVCKSILRADLGFWWTDHNFNYKEISNADAPK
jgi:hypothetical protein